MKTITTKNNGQFKQIDILDGKTTLQSKSGLAIGYLINEDDKYYILLMDSGVQTFSKSDWVKIG